MVAMSEALKSRRGPAHVTTAEQARGERHELLLSWRAEPLPEWLKAFARPNMPARLTRSTEAAKAIRPILGARGSIAKHAYGGDTHRHYI
jgi:hypothetical protein